MTVEFKVILLIISSHEHSILKEKPTNEVKILEY